MGKRTMLRLNKLKVDSFVARRDRAPPLREMDSPAYFESRIRNRWLQKGILGDEKNGQCAKAGRAIVDVLSLIDSKRPVTAPGEVTSRSGIRN